MRFSSDGRRSWRRVLLSAALAVAVPGGAAGAAEPFDEADIFFELNATAGDVGVHVSLDAERWKSLQITDPRGRDILRMEPQGRPRRSASPSCSSKARSLRSTVCVPRFLQLFPPGRYRFEGTTRGGDTLRSKDNSPPSCLARSGW